MATLTPVRVSPWATNEGEHVSVHTDHVMCSRCGQILMACADENCPHADMTEHLRHVAEPWAETYQLTPIMVVAS
jgi:ribosomal protein S27AE